MAKVGKFLYNNFIDKNMSMYVGDQNDWFKYADNDTMSYVLIVGSVKGYDEECGVLTFLSESGHTFWVSEDKIEMFWEHGKGFNIRNATTSTIKPAKIKINRDII